MLVLGAAGGLVLGILAALGLAALSTRLTNSADLREGPASNHWSRCPHTGTVKLDRVRRERLRTLANIVSLEELAQADSHRPDRSRGGREARDIAEALAELSAQQGCSDGSRLRRQ